MNCNKNGKKIKTEYKKVKNCICPKTAQNLSVDPPPSSTCTSLGLCFKLLFGKAAVNVSQRNSKVTEKDLNRWCRGKHLLVRVCRPLQAIKICIVFPRAEKR